MQRLSVRLHDGFLAPTLYRLIRYDDRVPPTVFDRLSGGCVTHLLASWYRIDGNQFEYADTMTFTPRCPEYRSSSPREANQMSGTVSHKGDTLVFRAVSKFNIRYEHDRGVLRRDTLFTGGALFDGPARVYASK
jgi:hypothetical protein